MINKKQRTKEVFYNNTNYTVPHTSLKHIDGFDVIEIENDLYVCELLPKKLLLLSAIARYS